jgi:iron(III) transport system substrate-binding protein
MRLLPWVIGGLLTILVGVPVLARLSTKREAGSPGARDVPTLVIVTPHVEQIRHEFGRAFSIWHQREHGTPARVDWRSPGGTSEIRKQLESQMQAAVAAGAFALRDATELKAPSRSDKDKFPEVIIDPARTDLPDLFMGGGSFEHNAIKGGFVVESAQGSTDGKPRKLRVRVSRAPATLYSEQELSAVFGENRIGIERLYDPDQHWFGTALSGFGIVYNRDLLRDKGLPEPTSFAELGNPRLVGKVALSDPRQSGSVATLYDSILNKEGWDKGWRTLREMSANARYFTASSTQPPLDVSQGECAVGVAIDFYGRGQAQSVLREGEDPASGRVGYVDPPGATYIDADPISMVNGARNEALARRFIDFCLTQEAQALWQFAPRANVPAKDSSGRAITLGPEQYRLRRMPVRRDMYAQHLSQFTDRTNPFEIAMNTKVQGWRDLLGPLMGAFAIDTRHEQRAAWVALNDARQRARAGGFPADRLAQMESLFYSFPPTVVTGKEGETETIEMTEANYRRLSEATGRWRDPRGGARAKADYTRYYQGVYAQIMELASAP